MRQTLPGSFRDPSGFIFIDDGVIFRQINNIYKTDYDFLFDSGLYSLLVEKNYLIPHQEVNIGRETDDAYKFIKPEQLTFISYPYEWSFSQLQDAALLTLNIQLLALQKNMSLKDASAYNVQFHQGKAIFIDTLSFEKLPDNQPWVAYRQFCQHFLAPLALMSKTDITLGQLLRTNIDGIPLGLTSKLLPFTTKFSFALGVHIHLHARAQSRYADTNPDEKKSTGVFSKKSFIILIESLKSIIKKLRWKAAGTEWHNYYEQNNNYNTESLSSKERIVAAFLQKNPSQMTWDLGANTGRFSRIATKFSESVCAWDIDPACVEKNYLQVKFDKQHDLLPLLLDLTNPAPAIGWNNDERLSFVNRGPVDMVLALGLIHHLAISANLPLKKIAEFLFDLTQKLIIEFIPKSDSQVKKLLQSREDIFTEYDQEYFEEAFAEFFVLEDIQPIPGTERILYLFRKITD